MKEPPVALNINVVFETVVQGMTGITDAPINRVEQQDDGSITVVINWPSCCDEPTPMLLRCPTCNASHIDQGEWATRPHKTHLCHLCGELWRPANVPTVGVARLEGGVTK